ncbi:polyprenyl synthetase family protein [Rothia sp. (in: high G+C Gram-positive bacteria)]|uniref:polyprenyl synthetase family protein n=1 Tax=unclassified Rothia (in: high G+C Gram-positive bacteria) TaxID=2689056 RepID=UPI000EE7E7BA|nr:geranylgeranyl pyrophosphate synthase [Rothia sp. (in: high G+C Gram-positive bacteria)]
MPEADFNLPKGFDLIAQDPVLGPKILEALTEVEVRLERAVAQTNHLADVASRHLLSAGGKRVRPLLTLLAAETGGGINDRVIDAAVVVELTHLATLYHDDVMDDAPKRRGVDTAQNIWGNSVAILTGDLIFSRASLIVSELGGRALAVQAQTFERLVLGQLFETTGPEKHEDLLTHYIKVIEGKTGSLIAAAGSYGTILSDSPEATVQMLTRYGELVGVAFQLADDVIDVTSSGVASGKTPGTDLREGVPTLPTILLNRAAATGDLEAQHVQQIIRGDLNSDEALAEAVAALSAHPVTEEAWQVAYRWADDAIAAIEPLPASIIKEALKSFAHAVVHRDN